MEKVTIGDIKSVLRDSEHMRALKQGFQKLNPDLSQKLQDVPSSDLSHALNAKNSIANVSSNIAFSKYINIRLNNELDAVELLDEIIVELDKRVGSANTGNIVTDKEFANQALSKLHDLLLKKDSAGYIFGGNTSDTAPINEDILTISNLDAENNATTNYTKSIKSPASIKLGTYSVTYGIVSADDKAVKSLLGAINVLKNEGKREDYTKLINDAKEGTKQLNLLIGQNLYACDLIEGDNEGILSKEEGKLYNLFNDHALVNEFVKRVSYASIQNQLIQSFYQSQRRILESMAAA